MLSEEVSPQRPHIVGFHGYKMSNWLPGDEPGGGAGVRNDCSYVQGTLGENGNVLKLESNDGCPTRDCTKNHQFYVFK